MTRERASEKFTPDEQAAIGEAIEDLNEFFETYGTPAERTDFKSLVGLLRRGFAGLLSAGDRQIVLQRIYRLNAAINNKRPQ